MAYSDTSAVQEKKTIFRAYQIIWYILAIVETVLFLRFWFRLTGASTLSSFVSTVYGMSAPLVLPFRGMYPTAVIERTVFEWQTLMAMLIYFLIAHFLVHFLGLVKPVNREEVERNVEEL